MLPSTRPTVVLLVRHGLTPTTGRVLPGRAPGLHLSDEGRRQAAAAARRIASLGPVAAVYSSPLERTRETAAPIARARGLRVQLDRDLLEADAGEWTGQSLKRLRRKPEWLMIERHPTGFRFPGGESVTAMQARVVSALARFVDRHPGRMIVVVSHADPIKAAVAHALGTHLDLFHRIAIGTASITAIAYRPQGPTVLTVNSADGDLAALGLR